MRIIRGFAGHAGARDGGAATVQADRRDHGSARRHGRMARERGAQAAARTARAHQGQQGREGLMKDPKDPIDTEVEDAYGALAERIPDGYFETFSSRVLARLGEASDMEGRREIARGSGLSRPDEAALTAAAGG